MIARRGSGVLGARIVVSLFFLLGCARVSLESNKPIKVDVTMRLDIYQHVTQDVQSIEDMVSSPKRSMLEFGVAEAYAQEEGDLPSDVKAAIDRRKARKEELNASEAKGIIGENAKGLVEIRDASLAGAGDSSLVSGENTDRRAIYEYVAQKNGATYEETAKISSSRIQSDAPSGTPIEVSDGAGGSKWVRK